MSSQHIGIEDARKNLGPIVTAIQRGDGDVVLTRNGKPAARIVRYQEDPMTTDTAIALFIGEQLFRTPDMDVDDFDQIQAGNGFTFDSGRSPGGQWQRYEGVKADDWAAVKAQARHVAEERAAADTGL